MYLRLLVDVGVHVQTLRVEDDDVPLPDGGRALVVQL